MDRIHTCDDILHQVDDTFALFNELQLQHQAVATKTKTLHDAFDRLLVEKQKLIEFAEALHSKLNYFDELENVRLINLYRDMVVGLNIMKHIVVHAMIDQCKREGFIQKIKDEEGEGCNIHGLLEVNKVAGNFHFVPGKSFHQSNIHGLELLAFQQDSYNISHRINRLAFGDYFPGNVNPLDGVQWAQESENGMYQYFIKVVPTIYTDIRGKTIHSNQFSSNAQWLAVSSDKGTVHVFSLKVDSGSLGNDRSRSTSEPCLVFSTCSVISPFLEVQVGFLCMHFKWPPQSSSEDEHGHCTSFRLYLPKFMGMEML